MDTRQAELYELERNKLEEARKTAEKMTKSELHKLLCEGGDAVPRDTGCMHCRCMCMFGLAYHLKLGHDIVLHHSCPYSTVEIN